MQKFMTQDKIDFALDNLYNIAEEEFNVRCKIRVLYTNIFSKEDLIGAANLIMNTIDIPCIVVDFKDHGEQITWVIDQIATRPQLLHTPRTVH